ncbi:DTW domain-containing protein 1 [Agrilus planipennis]|uniref:tRNA-uridine aminocarboxypropyltransferase 1 n=1 Tax=Agrilus planipennis TaxID=224129 RepID=A0A1W4XA47_AGRPL|nr:DTW domain-containing protein 1 [Agrilus planipennis]
MACSTEPIITSGDLNISPFDGMRISDNCFLKDMEGRQPCPKCYKSRKFFCYTCYVPIVKLEGRLPHVKLPVKVNIIKHRREIDGKSTAAHAAILAPDDVEVFTYPNIPNYDIQTTVLVYPSYKASLVSQLFKEHLSVDLTTLNDNKRAAVISLAKGFNRTTLLMKATENLQNINCKNSGKLPVKTVVFIDSTWSQSKGIYKDERIKSLPCVVLQNRVSQFWRHQKGSPRWYLATIEAVHQFLVEIHLNMWGVNQEYEGLKSCFQSKVLENSTNIFKDKRDKLAYNGQYDDLLFFFKYMYQLIHKYYEHQMLYAYKRRLL